MKLQNSKRKRETRVRDPYRGVSVWRAESWTAPSHRCAPRCRWIWRDSKWLPHCNVTQINNRDTIYIGVILYSTHLHWPSSILTIYTDTIHYSTHLHWHHLVHRPFKWKDALNMYRSCLGFLKHNLFHWIQWTLIQPSDPTARDWHIRLMLAY